MKVIPVMRYLSVPVLNSIAICDKEYFFKYIQNDIDYPLITNPLFFGLGVFLTVLGIILINVFGLYEDSLVAICMSFLLFVILFSGIALLFKTVINMRFRFIIKAGRYKLANVTVTHKGNASHINDNFRKHGKEFLYLNKVLYSNWNVLKNKSQLVMNFY